MGESRYGFRRGGGWLRGWAGAVSYMYPLGVSLSHWAFPLAEPTRAAPRAAASLRGLRPTPATSVLFAPNPAASRISSTAIWPRKRTGMHRFIPSRVLPKRTHSLATILGVFVFMAAVAPWSTAGASDSDPPTVTVTSDSKVAGNHGFHVTVTFSEPTSGFAMSDLVVTNGRATSMTSNDDGSEHTVYIYSPQTVTEVRVQVPQGAATDLAGNLSMESEVFRIWSLGKPSSGPPVPTVVCANGPTQPDVGVSAYILFSRGLPMPNCSPDSTGEAICDEDDGDTAFDPSKVELTYSPPEGGHIAAMASSPGPLGFRTYSYGASFWEEVSGDVTIKIPAGVVQDGDGNSNPASNTLYVSPNRKVSVGDSSATEGDDGTIDFEVTIDARNDCETATVDWATEDGSATAGDDYTAASGTLKFGPGERTKTVSIPVLDDSVSDDGETFTLRLSNASGATIDDTEATGTINNHETVVVQNTAPTGVPTISGTAQVGATLTADAGGIADADGLEDAAFAWQWIANDGTTDTDIAGATGSTWTLTSAEAGKTIKVRVTFTDDGDTEETLVSAATETVRVPLTARFEGVPVSHDGSGAFDVRVVFSEELVSATGGRARVRSPG